MAAGGFSPIVCLASPIIEVQLRLAVVTLHQGPVSVTARDNQELQLAGRPRYLLAVGCDGRQRGRHGQVQRQMWQVHRCVPRPYG